MDFEEYTVKALDAVQARTDKKYHVRKKEVVKNNGVKMTGIAFMSEKIGPCVYLDDFYRAYKKGEMGFDETVDRIYGMFMDSLDAIHDIDLSAFLEWDTVRGNIYAKLVNAGKNEEMLDAVPHRMFLDLMVVYYAVVGEFENYATGTVLINNKHMEEWGKEEDSLYRQAMENMRTEGKPFFKDMETVICGFLLEEEVDILCDKEPQPDTKMYVLSNCRRQFGAAEILDQGTLQKIADKIGDGFIVLPSSVHETIVLPPKNETEYGKLAEMVREVNDTQLMEEECLSYHVYVFNRNEDTLQIVA